MSWLRELKVGDQFLDRTGRIVATVTVVDKDGMRWKWNNGTAETCFWSFTDLESAFLFTEWVQLTPLLKELL